jgi:hypothetical protein
MSSYILENASEFERLEKQSQNSFYDYRQELQGIQPKPGALIFSLEVEKTHQAA